MEVHLLLFFASIVPVAEAAILNFYDPYLCYILDGFLGVYGLFITGMFIKEKFFKTKMKADDGIYTGLQGQDPVGYDELLRRGDFERGHTRHDETYTDLYPRTEGEYKELPVRERGKKNEQVYQGLSPATRQTDTYDQLQMQPLPSR